MKYSGTQKNAEGNIEMDDMNLRTHLNTSLDLSGINVSEDLINRTLAAIKVQAASYQDNEYQYEKEEPRNKVIVWNRYARGFAGVAAAALIIAIGYGAMTQVSFMSKNENTNSTAPQAEYSLSMDQADQASDRITGTESAVTEESASLAMEGKADKELPEEDNGQYGIASGTSEKSSEMTTKESQLQGSAEAEQGSTFADNTADDTDAGTSSDDNSITSALTTENTVYTFREVFLPEPAQVFSITISDNINNVSVTLTDPSEISGFYNRMDQHEFINGTEAVENQVYTIEVKNLQNESQYIMRVGDHISVHLTQGDTASVSYYDELGDAYLKQDLEATIAKYSN